MTTSAAIAMALAFALVSNIKPPPLACASARPSNRNRNRPRQATKNTAKPACRLSALEQLLASARRAAPATMHVAVCIHPTHPSPCSGDHAADDDDASGGPPWVQPPAEQRAIAAPE